jgi:pSer/pThr/pTyr-binding forkhead associated (FHA) protein
LSIPRSNVSTVATAPPKILKGTTPVPVQGDPLCFVLQPKTDGSPTSIGRSEGNDLVLSDESVSRHHLTLTHEATGWIVSCRDEASAGLIVHGVKLKAGGSAPLASGQKIELGNVVLTFMGPSALATRLQAAV